MQRIKRILILSRYFLEYIFVLIFYSLIRFLPLKVLRLLASIGGNFIYLIPAYKCLVLANLKIAFPEKNPREIRRIAKESFKNLCLTVFEFFWFTGKENLLAELSDELSPPAEFTKKEMSKNGIIWVSSHLGNWELAAMVISTGTKTPVAVLMRPLDNPFLNNLVVKSRSRGGNMLVYEKGAVKGMIKALKKGAFLATLIDQNTRVRDGGIFVDFFGLPVPTSRTPAFLYRKMNVIPAVGGCVRNGNRYKIFMRELPRPLSEYDNDEKIIQDILKINEEMIRQYPEQYLWLYKRWQYIPIDASDELAEKFPYYALKTNMRFYDKAYKLKEDSKK